MTAANVITLNQAPRIAEYDRETWKWMSSMAYDRQPKGSKYRVKGSGQSRIDGETYGYYSALIFGKKAYCFDLQFGCWSTIKKTAFTEAKQYGILARIEN